MKDFVNTIKFAVFAALTMGFALSSWAYEYSFSVSGVTGIDGNPYSGPASVMYNVSGSIYRPELTKLLLVNGAGSTFGTGSISDELEYYFFLKIVDGQGNTFTGNPVGTYTVYKSADLSVTLDPTGTWVPPSEPLPEVKYLAPTYVDNVASKGIDHWTTNTCASYTVVTSAVGAVTWGAAGVTNWYVVTNGEFQIDGNVTCAGHVCLVLCDGAKLTVAGTAESVAAIVTDTAGSFTVYGSTVGNGHLIATATNDGSDKKTGYCAGIGGSKGVGGKNITINGGFIEATGGQRGAGIGGGGENGTTAFGENIVINGGLVKANCSGEYGAGIGGGTTGYAKNVVINGGTVIATGGKRSAGIGSGAQAKGASADITINGGYVVATGGNKDDTISAIGNGYDPKVSPTASGICVSTAMKILADDNYPPTTEIANAGGDLTSALAGLQYAIIRMPTEYTDDCLTFSSDGAFTLSATDQKWDGVLWTSTDKATWTVWNAATVAAAQAGGTGDYRLHLRGDIHNTKINDPFSGYYWKLTPAGDNKIACTGNIETLRGATGDAPSPTPMAPFCYANLFRHCAVLTSAPALPATNLSMRCYGRLFMNCTSLTEAPALPAVNLYDWCYEGMFFGCSSLTSAPPVLPAMDLAMECYQQMFYGCTSLPAAPALPATNLAVRCYCDMFADCTSLTSAPPVLAAMTLTEKCYCGMFWGCTSLTTAPALPATNLAISCYAEMFRFCHSLTAVPSVLPATTLAKDCYLNMFNECTSLAAAPVLPATNMEDSCYDGLFSGCRSLTDIPALPVTVLKQYCYQKMFCDCSNLVINTTGPGRPWSLPAEAEASTNDAPNWGGYPDKYMFTRTGGDAPDEPVIGRTYYIGSAIATVTPQTVAHTTSKVYTNDTVEVVSPCKVPWGTTVKVVYTVDAGYVFADGTTEKSVTFAAESNPASVPEPQLPAAPFIPVASVTTGATTTLYGTIAEAWEAACAATETPVTLTLLTDIALNDTLVTIDGVNFTFDLNGKTLSAGGSFSGNLVKQCSGSELIIRNGTMTGAKSSAVFCESLQKMTIDGVVLTGNSSENGGAVYCSYNSRLLMKDCVVTNNVASGSGGGIYKATGDVGLGDSQEDRVVLIRTVIRHNRATNGNGGGVYYAATKCLAAGTMIRMADGTEKAVEHVAEGDCAATFDHEGGTNSTARVYYAFKGEGKATPFTLEFDTPLSASASPLRLSIVGCHDLLEQSSRKYVTITEANVGQYIGAKFYGADGAWHTLTNVTTGTEAVEYYSLYTAQHQNVYANGLLTVPDDVDYLLNIYELDGNLKADAEQLKADIAQYGLADFDETSARYGISRAWFDDAGTKYCLVAIGKQLVSREYLKQLLASVQGPASAALKPLSAPLLAAAPMLASVSTDPTLENAKEGKLTLGEDVIVTDNTAQGKPSNIYLVTDDGDWPALIALAVSRSGICAGVTTADKPGEGTDVTFVENGANEGDEGLFTSDEGYSVVRNSGALCLSVKPPPVEILARPTPVEHATATVYTNGFLSTETSFGSGLWNAWSNETAEVVYTAAEGYYFADGTMVKTNQLDTSKNPATTKGTLPAVPTLHRHCVCGDGACVYGEHSHEALVWRPWTSTTALPDTAGNWYLMNDVMVDSKWTPADGTRLCLNGKTVTSTTAECAIAVEVEISFLITDCNTVPGCVLHTGASGVNTYGVNVVGEETEGQPTGCFTAYRIALANHPSGGVFSGPHAFAALYDVAVTNNDAQGLLVSRTSTNFVFGGTIAGNHGYGIKADTATVMIEGTLITGNASASNGGGIYCEGSEITLRDVTVIGNRAATHGGGVYVGPRQTGKMPWDVKQSVVILDGVTVITNNVVGEGAVGNLYLDGGASFVSLAADHGVLDAGVSLSAGMGRFTVTENVTASDAVLFTSDNPAYVVRFVDDHLEITVPDVAFTPVPVDHTTTAVYTNDAPVEKSGEVYLLPSNMTATVVYTAEEGYAFSDCTTTKTNTLNTSTNPATIEGEVSVPIEIPTDIVIAGAVDLPTRYDEMARYPSFADAFTNPLISLAANIHVFGLQNIVTNPVSVTDWRLNLVDGAIVSIATVDAGEGMSGELVNITNRLAAIVGEGIIVLSVTNGTEGAAAYKATLEMLRGEENVEIVYSTYEPERKNEENPQGDDVVSQVLIVDDASTVEDNMVVLPGVETDGRITVDVTASANNDVLVAGKLKSDWDVVIVNETCYTLTVGAIDTGMNVLVTNMNEKGTIITLEKMIAGKNIRIDNNGHLDANVNATADITIRNTSVNTLVGIYRAGGDIDITGSFGSLSNAVVDAVGTLTVSGTNVITGPVDLKADTIDIRSGSVTAWSVAGDNHTAMIDFADVADSSTFAMLIDVEQELGDGCGIYTVASNASAAAEQFFKVESPNGTVCSVSVGGAVQYAGDKSFKLELVGDKLVFTIAPALFGVASRMLTVGTEPTAGGTIAVTNAAVVGSAVAVRAYPGLHWQFNGWFGSNTVNGARLTFIDESAAETAFEMPAADVAVTAVFALSEPYREACLTALTNASTDAENQVRDTATLSAAETAAILGKITGAAAAAEAAIRAAYTPTQVQTAEDAAHAVFAAAVDEAEDTAEAKVRFEADELSVTEGDALEVVVFGGSTNRSTAATVSFVKNTYTKKPKAYMTVNGVEKKVRLPLTLNWAKGDRLPKKIRLEFKSNKKAEVDKYFTLQLGSEVACAVGPIGICRVTVKDRTEVSGSDYPYVRALAWPVNGGKANGSGFVKKATAARTLRAKAKKWATFDGWYRADTLASNDFARAERVTAEAKLMVAQADAGTYFAHYTNVTAVIAVDDPDFTAADAEGICTNADGVAICTVGHGVSFPMTYKADANSKPRLSVTKLPRGLKFNRKSGLVTGIPKKAGTYKVKAKGKNLPGKHELEFVIIVIEE